jgi:hypothetical protein
MCQSQVVGYFQIGDNSFENPLTGKESENYNFKHLDYGILSAIVFLVIAIGVFIFVVLVKKN